MDVLPVLHYFMPLRSTCRQIRKEASEIFFSKAVVQLHLCAGGSCWHHKPMECWALDTHIGSFLMKEAHRFRVLFFPDQDDESDWGPEKWASLNLKCRMGMIGKIWSAQVEFEMFESPETGQSQLTRNEELARCLTQALQTPLFELMDGGMQYHFLRDLPGIIGGADNFMIGSSRKSLIRVPGRRPV